MHNGLLCSTYLLGEQGYLIILKFFPHPVLVFNVINEKILPPLAPPLSLFT